jgi:hypothetical protein
MPPVLKFLLCHKSHQMQLLNMSFKFLLIHSLSLPHNLLCEDIFLFTEVFPELGFSDHTWF